MAATERRATRVRPYATTDLESLYEICLRTGDAGEDASHLVEDPRLLGEVYAAPYAALEPEHAFVLDDGSGRASGYVLGALDTRAFEHACEHRWWPQLRQRYPQRGQGQRLDDLLVAMIHRPHAQAEEIVRTHPSHVHVDLLPEVQSAGWGRALIERVVGALRDAGSTGVHLGVSQRNKRAIGFYEHLGFSELRADALTRTMGMRL